jgi:hypothetical protein
MGQQEAMVKAVTDILSRFAFVMKGAKDRQAAADAERKALEAIPKANGNEVVTKMEEMEIRTRLRALSMAERMNIYAQAAAQGDTSIARSIKTAPAGEVLIEPEFVKRVDREFLERSKPDQMRRLQTLDHASEKLNVLAGAIQAALGSYGKTPSFPTPPITKMDLGLQNTQAAPAKSAADAPPVGGMKFQ